MTEPSEVLGRLPPQTRCEVGMFIYSLADRLADLDAQGLAAFGAVIAGEASGLMVPGEVDPTDPDASMEQLAGRMRTFVRCWEEMNGD